MNQYTLDGVPLRDPALRWFTDRDTGVRIVPARRQAEQRYPGVDGINYIPRSPYDPGSVLISLNVQGTSYSNLRSNMEFITGLFTQRGKLMELREHYDDVPSNDRIAMVTLASSVEPQLTSTTSALMSFIMSVPGTFWRSADVYQGITSAIPKAGQGGSKIFALPEINGGNAPIHDMIIKISGGTFGKLTLTDPSSGRKLLVNSPLLANEIMLIDTGNWNSIVYTSLTTNDTNWDMNRLGARSANDKVASSHGVGTMFTLEPSLIPEYELFGYRIQAESDVTSSSQAHSGTAFITYRARKSYL